ncbi:MAG: SpoIIE family protein phosphatase [Xanthomonadales bacterium]|nr:SpoIIE family protein phosphatase [Xanthomonadales bacterium]
MIHAPLELERLAGPALAQARWRVAHPFRIGRAEGNELELPETTISRWHASIEAVADGWILRDCGSRLGTRVNELALDAGASVALHAGDSIGIGPWRFRVEAASVDASAIVATPTHISLVRAVGNLAEQRLELLLRCAGEVAAATDEAALAEIVAEHALLGSGHARAAVLWRDGDEIVLRCLRPAAAADAAPWRFHAPLVRSAERGEIARLESEAEAGARAKRALCAPLMLDGHAEAFLYLESDRPATRRHADAPSFCHALARLAALALANLRRLASERERIALEADLERAREVQRRLLPGALGRLGGVAYALRLHPGRVVAGDVVDVFAIEGGRTVAVLGDVSGAGLGAGLVMASVQSFLRAGFAHDGDPASVIARLNAHLCAQASAGRFVTLWLGVFDADGARARFVDAGHGHALCLRSGSVDAVPTRGAIPLGIDAGAAFIAEELVLGCGEILLLHSDGLIEQRRDDGSGFGRERLATAISAARSPAEVVETAWAALQAHAGDAPPDDDTTVLALARA